MWHKRFHDIWHNDIQHNDTRHNSKWNATLSTTLSISRQHNDTRYRVLLCWVPLCQMSRILNVENKPFKPSVIMQNVVAPTKAGLASILFASPNKKWKTLPRSHAFSQKTPVQMNLKREMVYLLFLECPISVSCGWLNPRKSRKKGRRLQKVWKNGSYFRELVGGMRPLNIKKTRRDGFKCDSQHQGDQIGRFFTYFL